MKVHDRIKQRLRRSFLNNLPGKLARLAVALDALERRRPHAEAEARALAHRLRGTGTSYGYPEISRAGADAELATSSELVPMMRTLLQLVGDAIAEDKDITARRVLLVGPELCEAPFLRSTLEALRVGVHEVVTAAEAQRCLAREAFDLVVVDLALPDGDGRQVLASEPGGAGPQSGFVVVSAWASSETKRECIGAGAEYFLDKPLDPGLLCTALVNAVSRQGRVHSLATTDPLTGIGNRIALHGAFDRMQRRRGPQGPFEASLAVIDLDHFERFNDERGHAAGDERLREVARELRDRLRREFDHVVRWGSDEFIVLLERSAVAAAEVALRRVRTALVEVGVASGVVPFSAGVVPVSPHAALAEVLEQAREVLGSVKRSGRGRVEVVGASLDAVPRRVLLVEGDPLVAFGVQALLRPEGFEVVHASAPEALTALEHGRFAALVVDPYGPGVGDTALLSALQARGGARTPPVLAMTSARHEPEIARALARGVDDYLLRPCPPSELLARVRALVAPERDSAQPAA